MKPSRWSCPEKLFFLQGRFSKAFIVLRAPQSEIVISLVEVLPAGACEGSLCLELQ